MKSSISILVLFSAISAVIGGNILFLSGMPSPSHHIYNRVLVLGLADKGHNVTFLSADVVKKQTPNVHYIHLEKVYEALESNLSMDIFEFSNLNPLMSILFAPEFYIPVCAGIYKSKGLDVILNYPENFKFDAVVFDFTFGPCLIPLLQRFNFPTLISISAFANPPYTTDLIGGQKYPAYIPHYEVTYSTDMTFTQRFFNTILYFEDWLVREYSLYPRMEAMARERFDFDFLPLKQLVQKTAIMLVNTDSAIDLPEPLQPNMIAVGGLQIVDPKPLPENMEKFISKSKKGTILMSLGTNVKSNMLGNERLEIILKTFASIPEYNFLWKFESEVDELPIKPTSNVMISKFLPQNDILAHPNIKAFISHGGMLSTHETLWHGKPIIGIPFFVDQKRNMEKNMKHGLAVRVDINTFNTEDFKKSILTVLNDEKYYKNAQQKSKLFRDKPQRPLEVAVWWIEYAMRNENLDFLKSPTINLGPLKSKSYDVILTIIAVFHAIVFLIVRLIKRICKGGKKNKRKVE